MSLIPRNHNLIPGKEHNIVVHLDTLPPHFTKHRHSFLEIYVIISGKGKEIINGKEYELIKGAVTFLLPWHVHELFSDEKNPLKLIRCNFGMETMIAGTIINSELMSIIYNQLHTVPSFHLESNESKKMIQLFENLLEEFQNFWSMKEIMLKTKITEILINFNRERAKLNLDEQSYAIPSKINGDLSFLLAYIHRNWNKNINYSEIAKEFGINKEALDAFCEENTGTNFINYLNEVRLRYSSSLLATCDLNVDEIATIAGYQSITTFYRAFKNFKGVTPTEYRQYYLLNEGTNGMNQILFPSPLMWKIHHYIQLHYSEDISLESVAKEFHYSNSSISEICRREAGQSFVDLLNECRIIHACSYLDATKLKTVEVGFSVGFNSAETFFRAFKKFRSMSPGAYRKEANAHIVLTNQ